LKEVTMSQWQPDPAFPADPGGGSQPPDPAFGAVPAGGYTTPPQPAFTDPLVSPNYNGWWNRSISIVKRGWKPLAALQAIGVALALLLEAPAAGYGALMSDDINRAIRSRGTDGLPDLTSLVGLIGIGVAGVLLTIIIGSMVTIATVHVGVSVAMQVPVRISEAVALAARRVFPLIGWQLLALPIYIAGLCLCVLPVIYVAAVFLVLPVVVAVERTNAIGRCFRLFHRDLGSAVARTATILGILLAASLVGGVIGSVFEAAARTGAGGTAGIVTGSVVSTLVTALISGAVAVLVAPLTLTAYADLRARVEPVDATVIAQEIGLVPPSMQPPAQPWPA
jgi:hypothetical protein